jgi:hypothetical protein
MSAIVYSSPKMVKKFNTIIFLGGTTQITAFTLVNYGCAYNPAGNLTHIMVH